MSVVLMVLIVIESITTGFISYLLILVSLDAFYASFSIPHLYEYGSAGAGLPTAFYRLKIDRMDGG